MSTDIAKRNYIEEFRGLFFAGTESLVKACRVYVDAIKDNPERVFEFQDAFKNEVPVGCWAQFEAVGKKCLHPRLLLNGGGKYGGRIRKLPYSLQEQILEGDRFDLLTANGETLKVDIREVQPEQADQLFDYDHIRSLPEQRAFIESRKQTPPEDAHEVLPYTIRGEKVFFTRGVVLTKRELKRILDEM